MELTQLQQSHLLKRLPDFELSYETISHNKVSTEYDIAFAIPTGKKAYIWFTFQNNIDVCYFMDLNKDKKITKCIQLNNHIDFKTQLSLGTILYGSIVIDETTKKQRFVIEDLIYYKGITMKKTLLFYFTILLFAICGMFIFATSIEDKEKQLHEGTSQYSRATTPLK
jgi:uncharacterized protein YxeA